MLALGLLMPIGRVFMVGSLELAVDSRRRRTRFSLGRVPRRVKDVVGGDRPAQLCILATEPDIDEELIEHGFNGMLVVEPVD